MDTKVQILVSVYVVVIKRFRAMRPLTDSYRPERFNEHFVNLGCARSEVEDVTQRIATELAAVDLSCRRSPERVRAVNEAFLRLGLPNACLQPEKLGKHPVRPHLISPSQPADQTLTSLGGEGEHLVYMLFDRARDLLYVGITSRGPTRLVEHYRLKPWFNQVARVEFERYMTREISAARETFLIKALHPLHNIVHNASARSVA